MAIAFRADWLHLPHGKVILPILGSMFMFRMLLYLHEQQQSPPASGIWQRIHYFLMLPNLALVIFPVIDYSTFLRQYYARPSAETCRRGLLMMANGVVHFLLYRFIYYYLLPAPSAVTDFFSLAQYLVASYALIVRLAGIFHFAAGVVCLFGFHPPPVFDHYFLASNFSDIWRRINIYWRDFMTKVFYFPIYFRLKHWGTTRAMVAAILLVFAINWFLHAWQWFWIRGAFPLTSQDLIFWSIFGIAVAINTWLQVRRPRPTASGGSFSLLRAGERSFQVLAMFTAMTLLWSFWTAISPEDWWLLLQVAGKAPVEQHFIVVGVGIMAAGLGTLAQYLLHVYPVRLTEAGKMRAAVLCMGALTLFAWPTVHQQLVQGTGSDLEPVFRSKLNAYDKEQLYKGYYETLLVGNNLNSRIWEMEKQKPDDWNQLGGAGAGVRRDDIMLKELSPNQSIPFKGGLFTTNSHGFRDREYSLEKPPNTLRIALIGGSIEMGVGVNTGQTFENLTEDAINASGLFGPDIQVEILNFAISGNHLFQNIAMFEKKAAAFQPDIVVYAAHANETYRILHSIYKTYATGRDLTYPMLYDLMDRHQLKRNTREAEFMRTLAGHQDDITHQGYSLLRHLAKERQILPVWLYVPTLDDNEIPGEADRLQRQLKDLGFQTLRIDKAYQNINAEALKLAEWDTHPNTRGHQLLAKEWTRVLKKDSSLKQSWLRHAGLQ